ncbi:MAG: tetratricopeptide repeat protein [Verrucomicrobiota bacterium]
MNGDSRLLRGVHLRSLGRHEEAEGFFREAISQDANDPEPYAELALSLIQMEGRKTEALSVIDAAVGLDPEDDSYHAVRSLVLSHLDR